MTSTIIKTTISGISASQVLEHSSYVLNSVFKTLRMIGDVWEESRAEYKKHAILGGGWE
jgi:hypothetical protein